ncbi:hypothetical protein ACI2UK_13865 [Ralstonia nicotianae]|uniref:hypothetical protein n=1 Tax=Ralstonia pseudosolanacearum TaxID=1310165 RepID=UPI0020067E96|nr:hypothetical protein [Ralstonia pseudosolanacearum]MCK4118370.1 hypothetical protein [Ralstonia pseudosolanacearum]
MKTAQHVELSSEKVAELRGHARKTVRRLANSMEPLIAIWTGRSIKLSGLQAKRAATNLRRPNCLGVYSDNATIEEVLSDLVFMAAELQRHGEIWDLATE